MNDIPQKDKTKAIRTLLIGVYFSLVLSLQESFEMKYKFVGLRKIIIIGPHRNQFGSQI